MAHFFLFGMVVLAHCGLVLLLVYGHWWQFLITGAVYFLTGCLGMSMTYHRLLSHRSWNASRGFEYLGTLLGTLGLTGTSIAWTAIHRDHHAHTDQPRDPHSPLIKGFFRAHFLSMFEKPNLKLAKDLIRSPFHRALHKHYLWIHLSWASILYFIDPFAVVYAYLAPAAILWNGGSSVNSFCHYFGYKNFETKNNARNNWIFAYLTWGEGWHNNHHRYPRKKTFAVKPYEFDISALMIQVFEKKNRLKSTP